MIDEKKIAFISCVNDSLEYEEALNYIESLEIPDGYSIDTIAVQEADSMAEGYQAAMESSNAKYKVYMHQDVFICNKKFIENLIDIFKKEQQVGMIGMVGRKELPERILVAADWDTGNIHFNGGNICCNHINNMNYEEVDAVDGLLIATQYDIAWRSDLFDGWDFYDISQCMEFRRKGYKIVVPFQKTAWCDHDNTYSRLNKYFYYQKIFCNEYQDIKKYDSPISVDSYVKLERDVQKEKACMEQMVNSGQKQELWDKFVKMEGQIHMGLQEFYLLSQIDHLESSDICKNSFWENGLSWNQLKNKIRIIKYKLKRIENGLLDNVELKNIYQSNSIYAIILISLEYTTNRKECVKRMKKWHCENNMQNSWGIWEQIAKINGLM